jgi:hypothetical protein
VTDGFAAAARRAARVATGVLGWSPDSFWSATPADLLLALEGTLGRGDEMAASPVGADTLAALRKEFPDG